MKSIAIFLGVMLSMNAFAAEQELAFTLNAAGQPNFGIQYAYDIDAAFAFTHSTTLTNQALASLPNAMMFNIVNVNTGQIMADWSTIGKSDLMVGSLGISSKPAIAKILPNLKNAKFVFGTKDQQGGVDILYSIPIGPLCQNHPDHFMDLSNPSKAACSVTANDLPDWGGEVDPL